LTEKDSLSCINSDLDQKGGKIQRLWCVLDRNPFRGVSSKSEQGNGWGYPGPGTI